MDNATRAQLRAYIEGVARLQGGKGYEAFVLAHGALLDGVVRPQSIRKQRAKECFANALRLAQDVSGLIYCEGWATSIIPVHHAWCVTADGQVVDNTWPDAEQCAYFGVAFARRYVARVIGQSRTYGLFYKRETHELATDPTGVPDGILYASNREGMSR